MSQIELKEAIATLREELIESIIASRGESLRFEVGEISLEFQVEIEKTVEGKGGIKFWVVELGGGGNVKDKNTHKITIPLKPVRQDGKPILTGSAEAVPE